MERQTPPEGLQTMLSRDREAVVWVGRFRALVARRGAADDEVLVEEMPLPPSGPGRSERLAQVVHSLRDCDRVRVAGGPWERTGFEREYVAIVHRPDRLVDLDVAVPMSRAAIVRLLRDAAN